MIVPRMRAVPFKMNDSTGQNESYASTWRHLLCDRCQSFLRCGSEIAIMLWLMIAIVAQACSVRSVHKRFHPKSRV
eukprot:COSAG02_NODE_1259_length_13568_cov_747.342267_11_plen_76_part_00